MIADLWKSQLDEKRAKAKARKQERRQRAKDKKRVVPHTAVQCDSRLSLQSGVDEGDLGPKVILGRNIATSGSGTVFLPLKCALHDSKCFLG